MVPTLAASHFGDFHTSYSLQRLLLASGVLVLPFSMRGERGWGRSICDRNKRVGHATVRSVIQIVTSVQFVPMNEKIKMNALMRPGPISIIRYSRGTSRSLSDNSKPLRRTTIMAYQPPHGFGSGHPAEYPIPNLASPGAPRIHLLRTYSRENCSSDREIGRQIHHIGTAGNF